MSCERTVGTLRFAPPYGLCEVPYRAVANLRKLFRKIVILTRSTKIRVITNPPRKNTRFAARKIARTGAAFSLPQDLVAQLMFGAAGFGEPPLSGSRGLGFHIAPRRPRSPRRLGTPRKCFNQHRIFDTTRRLAAP
jgi:hypothetical protein